MCALASQISQRACSSASPASAAAAARALEDADRRLQLALLGVGLAERPDQPRGRRRDRGRQSKRLLDRVDGLARVAPAQRQPAEPAERLGLRAWLGARLERSLVEVARRVEIVQPQRDVCLDELRRIAGARERCPSRGTPRRPRASPRSCAAAGATPRVARLRAERGTPPSSRGTRAGAGSAQRRVAPPSGAAPLRPRRRRASGSAMTSSLVSTVRCL